jgi:hypothetical protein
MYWEAPAEWSDCSTDAVEAVMSSGKGRVPAKRIHDGFSRLAVESRRHHVRPARLVSVDTTDEAHAAARGGEGNGTAARHVFGYARILFLEGRGCIGSNSGLGAPYSPRSRSSKGDPLAALV